MKLKIILTVLLTFCLSFMLPAYSDQLSRVSNDTPLNILDNNASGITSELEITAAGSVMAVSVNVDINHSYIGDLTLRLLCPDGEEAILHNRSGGSTDNIKRSYELSTCNGQPVSGNWRLFVSDHADLDIGSLQSWELNIEISSPTANMAPLAHAGMDISVSAGQTGMLNGSASSDPNGDTLLFNWTQTQGPTIFLSNAESARPTFIAPVVNEDTNLVFSLTVNDGVLTSLPDTVVLNILTNSPDWEQVRSSMDTPLAIPDANTTGIFSKVEILSNGNILSGEAMVNINHTYTGDLQLKLQCPSGTEIMLHNRNGGDSDNLIKTYPLDACLDQPAKGQWRILVSDHARQDVGTLNSWEIRLNLGDHEEEVWDIDNNSINTPLAIPDNNTTGISSEIVIQTNEPVLQAEVKVEIDHTYIGDLQVILRCPNGVETILHDRTDGNTDGIHGRYVVAACNNQSPAGTWQLLVNDSVAQDSGVLTGWSLRLKLHSNNIPRFQVQGIESWYLIGNDLTPGQNQLNVSVQARNYTGDVLAQIDNNQPIALPSIDSLYSGNLDISDLQPGEHRLQLTASGGELSIAELNFVRSHPLYVVVSNDWDSSDNSDIVIARQEQLHADHPQLKLTHFVGPYTFTDPAVSTARRAFLVEWLTGLRDTEGDEIGLHIHPYCIFVDTVAEVRCRHQPSYTLNEGDTSGYTVLSSAYTEAEYLRLLTAAKAIFAANNLGRPVAFRAGGWIADLGVLRALVAAGFVVDSSANNWARLDELEDLQNGVLFAWNRQNWSSIGDTSQPYYPASDNILLSSDNTLNILEVPDNGSLVDYVSGAEMITIFQTNWDGTALTRPIAYSIGYHPVNYSSYYHSQIQLTLNHIDQYLATHHQGPVIYETLTNLTRVWQN